jgi:hypothetical protein
MANGKITSDGPCLPVCTDVTMAGRSLSFAVPAVKGSWSGALDEHDLTLAGIWIQGGAKSLKLARNTFIAAATPSPIDGIWPAHLSVDEQARVSSVVIVLRGRYGHEFDAVPLPPPKDYDHATDCQPLVRTEAH